MRLKHTNRPVCTVPQCHGLAMVNNVYVSLKTGHAKFLYRKVCGSHHKATFHPYHKHRKTYCENQDGRLGFVCGWKRKFTHLGMLEVDHIHGRTGKYPHRPSNLQTLCSNCHKYKTNTTRRPWKIKKS